MHFFLVFPRRVLYLCDPKSVFLLNYKIMKKLFVAVAALATMLFMSCTKEQTTDAKLQGTWTVKSVDVKLYENDKEIQIPETLKGFLKDINAEDAMESLAEGATLTFSKGKVTSSYTRDSEKVSETNDYTIDGNFLSIKVSEDETLKFTIKELTASSLVLTLDALKTGDIPAEAKKALENYSVLIVISLTK